MIAEVRELGQDDFDLRDYWLDEVNKVENALED